MHYSTVLVRLKKFFTKKKIIWAVILLFVLFSIWFFFLRNSSNDSIQTAKVVRQDVKKTVLTTGQVVSSIDLALSFQTSGFVRRINVKEGDIVKAGQTLAVLDKGGALASLESAKGALAQAEANYQKILAGATFEDIAVTQASVNYYSTSLENAKQDLENELPDAYNNANTAILSYTNILFSNPQTLPQFSIIGTIQTNSQAISDINSNRTEINNILKTWQSDVLTLNESNIEAITDSSIQNLSTISNYLTNLLLILTAYTQITSGGSQTTVTTYASGVATAKSTVDTAKASITNLKQAKKSAEANLVSAEASMALKKAPARPEDISIALAQVLSAQGQVHTAETILNNTVIYAPISGTITEINIKLGELATAGAEVLKLLNVAELHTEAQVSEADIASIVIGQTIDNTFDALGPDKHFQGKVLTVNPASTVVSGVINYKVTGSLENITLIKPGMTANMTVLVTEKKEVLIVPTSAVINKNSKKLILVIDDPKEKTYHEVEVSTNLEADGGLVEIISGLTAGEEIVTYIK